MEEWIPTTILTKSAYIPLLYCLGFGVALPLGSQARELIVGVRILEGSSWAYALQKLGTLRPSVIEGVMAKNSWEFNALSLNWSNQGN